MGTPPLFSPADSISPRIFNFPGSGAARTHLPHRPDPQRDVAARVQPNQEQALTNAFDSAVYRSLESRQSLSAQLSTLQAQLGLGGDGGTGQVGFEASQLTFDFFSETRYEELALFNKRTDAVGNQVDGPNKASFFAARQEFSARFELSISISGAALNGFATTAEGAAGSNELLDRLLEVAQKLLGQSDDLLNGFFSLLDSGDGGFNAGSLNDLFNQFIAGVLDTFSQGLFSGPGLPGGATGQGGDGSAGGGTVQASSVQLEFNFAFSASVSSTQGTVQQGDPIVLDLNGDGISLSNYQKGARFDLLGSGRTQQVAFVQGGDAFLALDRNRDGIINTGKELFGEQNGARNGFEELRKFDGNRDGVINRNDAVYNDLRLFRDNGNGITEAGELLTLADAGVDEIQLDYRDVDERAAGGNRISQIASYLRSDGTRGRVADALLNYIA